MSEQKEQRSKSKVDWRERKKDTGKEIDKRKEKNPDTNWYVVRR